MAADTKRALGLGVWHGAGYYKALNLGGLREHLAAQGLHVVTAADKAVLDAMVNVNSAWLEEVSKTSCGPLGSACRAELARRGLKT